MSPVTRFARGGLLVLSLLLIFWFLRRNQQQTQLLLSIRPWEIAGLIVLQLAYFFVLSESYRVVVVRYSETSIACGEWFRLFILGRFLNTVVPQIGNVYRATRLKHDFGISYTSYLTALLSFAWIYTCLNLLVSFFVLRIMGPDVLLCGLPAHWAALALALISIGGPVGLRLVLRSALGADAKRTWLQRKLTTMVHVSAAGLRDVWHLLRVVLLGLVGFALGSGVMYLCFRALDVEIVIAQLVWFLVLLRLSTHFNLTPGNLGVLELGFGLLGQQMGLGLGVGVLVSAIARVVSYTVLVALAIPLAAWTHLIQDRDGHISGKRVRSEA